MNPLAVLSVGLIAAAVAVVVPERLVQAVLVLVGIGCALYVLAHLS